MRLISACSSMYGCVYSELALALWPISRVIRRAYGREPFMRSCALRIFEAETISSARVTLRVFCTLLILVLISLPPAIFSSRRAGLDPPLVVSRVSKQRVETRPTSPGARRLELFDALLERGFDVVVPVAGGVDLVHQLADGVGEVRVQRLLESADLADRDIVHVALVDGVDRQRLLRDRHRRVLLLLHQFGDALAALELLAGGYVEVGGELR